MSAVFNKFVRAFSIARKYKNGFIVIYSQYVYYVGVQYLKNYLDALQILFSNSKNIYLTMYFMSVHVSSAVDTDPNFKIFLEQSQKKIFELRSIAFFNSSNLEI